MSQDLNQYCGFRIDGEDFAIPVMDIQEVIKEQKVTKVPLAQSSVGGLLNLRGQIVTCLNLRTLFGREDELPEEYMNIIVRGEEGLFSLMVDEVTDIIEVNKGTVERIPETLSQELRRYVENVYRNDDGLVVLVDVDKLIALEKENECIYRQ